MKSKLIAIIACGALAGVLALGGCASGSNQPAAEEQGGAAAEQPQAPETAPATDEPQAGMANPWSDVATAAEAASVAGFDAFTVPEGDIIIEMHLVSGPTFRAMKGIAEANYDTGAAAFTIRKGLHSEAPADLDISGVYGDYAHTWTVDVNGVTVDCFGNKEGKAMKTLWSDGDIDYSIYAQGLGGDDDYGITAEEVATLVSSIK